MKNEAKEWIMAGIAAVILYSIFLIMIPSATITHPQVDPANQVRLKGVVEGIDAYMVTVTNGPGGCQWDNNPIQTFIFGSAESDQRFQFNFNTTHESVAFCIYKEGPELVKTIGGDYRKKWDFAAKSAELEVDDVYNGYSLDKLEDVPKPVHILTDKNASIILDDVYVDIWYLEEKQTKSEDSTTKNEDQQ